MKIQFFKSAAALFVGVVLFAVGCTDYAVDIQKVDQKVDNLSASIDQQIAGINATIATLETAAKHKEDIDKLSKTISDLETALKEDYQGKIQDAVDNLTTEINKKVDQVAYELDKANIEKAIKDVNDALDAAKDRIKAIEDAGFQKQIDDLNTELGGRLSVLENLLAGDWKGKTVKETIESVAMAVADLETALSGKIAALDERLTNAENAIKTIIEETIPGLKVQLSELEALKAGKLDKATFDEYKEATAVTMRLMQNAIQNLADTYLSKAVFDEKVAEIMSKFDDYLLKTTFNDFVKIAATDAELEEVKAYLEGRIKVCEDLLAGDWGGKTVQEYILSLIAGGQEGLSVVVATQAELAAVKAYLEGRIKVCEDLLAGDWGGKTVQEYIDSLAATVADLETALSGKINKLTELLLGRVQSVVFVPAFDDGKMTVSGSGPDINTFKIMPADAAKAVVTLFSTEPTAFSFDVKTVATRSGEGDAALKLSVTDVKLNAENADKGWVDVSVSSNYNSLSDADKAKKYTAALVISAKEKGISISSPFYNISH